MILDRTCKTCYCTFPGGPRAYYCPSCRVEQKRQAKARYLQKKRLGIGIRHIGSTDRCERCSELYTVESGLQRFCPNCQPIHAAEYDAKTGLSFYHSNKENINPTRNERRRKGPINCVYCGKEFDPGNSSITCSDSCRRSDLNRKQREARYLANGPIRPEGTYSIPQIAKTIGKNRITVLRWYNAGKLPSPVGLDKRGHPYWLHETIDHLLTNKKPK